LEDLGVDERITLKFVLENKLVSGSAILLLKKGSGTQRVAQNSVGMGDVSYDNAKKTFRLASL
jgi:hypothetical protein